MHSAQYLWITRYFAKRDAEQSARAGGWSPWRYWITLVAGGAALFLPVPWLASYGWHVDFSASIFIVAAIVNLHHFMIDGVVWKLRNPRVGRVLVHTEAAAAKPAPATAGRAAPARRPAFRWAWRVALVAGLAALAAVDQWRYVLAIGHGERDRLADAARLNPYDSGAYLRLAQAESAAGDPAAAAAALRRAVDVSPQNPILAQALVRRLIEAGQFDEAYRQCQALLARWPDDVNALVNAGVLADRLGDAASAERWWTQAIALDPSQRRVHLYLAERLDARGAGRDALPHYQRYLELVTRAAAADRPDPREVVAVVVKFGDALARDGQAGVARTQYNLAIRMAGQTGLSDLGTLAETQRRALDAPPVSAPIRSEAAAVYQEALRGARAAVVRGQEQHHLRELVGVDAPLQRLVAQRALLAFGRPPFRQLPFGRDPARKHAVHPDVVRAERPRHRPRQPLDARLRDRVAGEEVFLHVIAAAADVDDRAAAARDHAGRDRLDGEEVVAQVGVEAVVPVLGRHRLPRVAIVAGGVVHQHADAVEIGDRRGAYALQRGDVDQIDVVEARPMPGPGPDAGLHDGAALFGLDVGEPDATPLPRELLDEGAADAVGAAGDEDAAVDEGRVRREAAGGCGSRSRGHGPQS